LNELGRDEIATDAIELPAERTKSGLAHTIPITPMIRRVLDTLPRYGKFVLNGTDRPFGDHSGAKEMVMPGIRPWTLHTFAEASRADYSGLGLPRIFLNWP
jgi:hypothetical protein